MTSLFPSPLSLSSRALRRECALIPIPSITPHTCAKRKTDD